MPRYIRRFTASLALLAIVVAAGFVGPASGDEPPSPADLVKTVADAVLRDFPEPPPFNWGEGVMMAGMMRAHRLTGDERYLKFVRTFADHWHREGIEPVLQKRGYCGHWGPGYPVLMLYETTGDRRYLEMVDTVNRFMLDRAERTRDGGLSHFNGKVQLWVDTLAMCCPVLSHSSRVEKRPELQEEAVRQLEIFAKHVQDPETGLFYHMFDEETGERTAEYWARGNGWVVMSYTEVLKHEKPDSPARARLVKAYRKQLAGIVELQDSQSGLWRTVLDQPHTYLETSAAAMFLYGMVECRNLKLIDAPYDDAIEMTWRGLAAQVDAEGRVVGVSEGTGPRGTEHYTGRKQGTYTWGTGAFLMAASALAEGK